jgi:hypothetical protein
LRWELEPCSSPFAGEMRQPKYDWPIHVFNVSGVSSTITPLFSGHDGRRWEKAAKNRVQYSSPKKIRRPVVFHSVI